MNLQEAIEQAGSPVELLWRAGAPPWTPPVIPAEFVGWSAEQAASSESVALSDLSHHMSDLFIDGPDATRLLSECSANNYESFEVGQAKQFVAVTERGCLISDGILLRNGQNRFTLTGPAAAQNWVHYHGARGDFEVLLSTDPDSAHRAGASPVLFRYQIQGPNAAALAEKVFNGPVPAVKFFHSTEMKIDGRYVRALRHGMTAQPGYELVGAYDDGAFVKEALLKAGEEFGLVQVGARAYSTNAIESGWVPTQVPGIYSDPELRAYREYLAADSYEGHKYINGSFFSTDIEDYYVSPFDVGIERSINFSHDFIGRNALLLAADQPHRTKVTLELNTDDFHRALGGDPGFLVTHGRYRVEHEGELVGMTCHLASIAPAEAFLSVALVDQAHAAPGTNLTLIWGEHPGPGTAPDADLGFPQVRVTVHPSPFNEFARTGYRQNAPATT